MDGRFRSAVGLQSVMVQKGIEDEDFIYRNFDAEPFGISLDG